MDGRRVNWSGLFRRIMFPPIIPPDVTVTAPVIRYFYVSGEVNPGSSGGRIPYTGQITVSRAIAAAGDFNPFADRKHVRLYRVDGTMKRS